MQETIIMVAILLSLLHGIFFLLQIYQEMIDNDEVEGPSEPEKLLLEVYKMDAWIILIFNFYS